MPPPPDAAFLRFHMIAMPPSMRESAPRYMMPCRAHDSAVEQRAICALRDIDGGVREARSSAMA